MTVVSCPCGSRFQAAPHLAGQRVPCPNCRRPLDIPAAAPAAGAVQHAPPQSPAPVRAGQAAHSAAPKSSGGVASSSSAPANAPPAEKDSASPPSKRPARLVVVGTLAIASLFFGLIVAGAVWLGRSSMNKLKPPVIPDENSLTKLFRSSDDSSSGAEDVPAGQRAPKTLQDLDAFYAVPQSNPVTTKDWLEGSRPFRVYRPGYGKGEPELFSPSIRDKYFSVDRERASDDEFLRKRFAEWDAAFEQLHRAARSRGAARYPLDAAKGIAMDLEFLEDLKNAHRALVMRAGFKASLGEHEEVLRCLDTCFAMQDTLILYPRLEAQYKRLAMHQGACNAIINLLTNAKLTQDHLDHFQNIMSDSSRGQRDDEGLWRGIVGEHVIAWNVAAHPDRHLNYLKRGESLLGSGDKPLREHLKAYPAEWKQRDLEALTEWMNRAAAATHLPWPGRGDTVFILNAEIDDLATKTPEFRPSLAVIVVPKLKRAFDAAGEARLARAVGWVAIAAERYRRQSGEWPKQAELLVPTFLAAIPLDPNNGAPLSIQINAWGQMEIYGMLRSSGYTLGARRKAGALAGAALRPADANRLAKPQPNSPAPSSTAGPSAKPTALTKEDRKKIYEEYVKMLQERMPPTIDLEKRFKQPTPTQQKVIENSRNSQRKHIEAVVKLTKHRFCTFYAITPEQMEEIIAEGEAALGKTEER